MKEANLKGLVYEEDRAGPSRPFGCVSRGSARWESAGAVVNYRSRTDLRRAEKIGLVEDPEDLAVGGGQGHGNQQQDPEQQERRSPAILALFEFKDVHDRTPFFPPSRCFREIRSTFGVCNRQYRCDSRHRRAELTVSDRRIGDLNLSQKPFGPARSTAPPKEHPAANVTYGLWAARQRM